METNKFTQNDEAEIIPDISTGDSAKVSIQQQDQKYPLQQMARYVKPQK